MLRLEYKDGSLIILYQNVLGIIIKNGVILKRFQQLLDGSNYIVFVVTCILQGARCN